MNARQKKKQVAKKMKVLEPLSVQEQVWCRKYYNNGSSVLINYYAYLVSDKAVEKLSNALVIAANAFFGALKVIQSVLEKIKAGEIETKDGEQQE